MTSEQMEKVWPECEECAPSCNTCMLEGTNICGEFCNAQNSFDMYRPITNYCPNCGRPLDPAAWAELKKRLEEADDGKTLVKNLSPGARFEWQGMMWIVISHDERGTVMLGDEELPLEEIRKLRREADDGREV